MEKYGSDKPDLRNPLIIQDVTQLFKDTEFNAFKRKNYKSNNSREWCRTRKKNSLIIWENML